jgi:hypothetical protein
VRAGQNGLQRSLEDFEGTSFPLVEEIFSQQTKPWLLS